jgi:Recombination endonuclease VII
MTTRYVDQRLAELATPNAEPTPARRAEHRATRAQVNEWARQRRSTERGRALMRASNLRQRHSITLKQYAELYQRQGGRCAICGNAIAMGYDPDRPPGKRGPAPNAAHLDHDHGCCASSFSCGRCIRGLLCGRCNSGVERFRDDADLLRRAADYLSRSKPR